jgi:hypothetical protein
MSVLKRQIPNIVSGAIIIFIVGMVVGYYLRFFTEQPAAPPAPYMAEMIKMAETGEEPAPMAAASDRAAEK